MDTKSTTPKPASDAACRQVSPVDGHLALNHLLDALVQLTARRLASIITEDGDDT